MAEFCKKNLASTFKSNIDMPKINCNKLEIFKIIIVSFLLDKKNRKSRFFEEIFLLVECNIDLALEILFFTLSNVKINFNI